MDDRLGILLDVGCGSSKQAGWVGMDLRPCEGVDIVHDVTDLPWPFPPNYCLRILMSHIYEHIEPKYRFGVIDEAWRIMKPGGQLLLSAPHASSMGAHQDPSHYTCPNEVTFQYFDPTFGLYNIYHPKPWKLVRNDWNLQGSVEVIMEPMK